MRSLPGVNADRTRDELSATGGRRLSPDALSDLVRRRRAPTIGVVQPTTVGLIAAALIAPGAVGAFVGASTINSRRARGRGDRQDRPVTSAVESPLLPPGAAAVLSALRSGSVVVDRSEAV